MELSHSDIYSLLEKALNKGVTSRMGESIWIRDVYPTYFIYRNTDSKLYQRTYSIDAAQQVTMGDAVEVVQVTNYAPVVKTSAFTLQGQANFSEGGSTVLRKGKIFEAGNYEEVGYSMTPDELANAATNFQPVPLDLEHMPTVLDGKLGTLQSVEVSEDGKSLFGTVALPSWLDSLLDDTTRKVSCTWDRATKQLAKLAITRTPRVSDAALFGAYATFAGQRHSAADLKDLQNIHDLVVKQGATCAPVAEMSNPKKEKSMNAFVKWFKSLSETEQEGVTPEQVALFAKIEEGGSSTTTTTTVGTPPPAPSPAPPQPTPSELALMSEVAQMKAERRTERAAAKIDALVLEGKLYPYERTAAIASFAKALEDDERDNTLVTFSDAEGNEQKATRAALLEAQFNMRLPHSLTSEQVAAFALANKGDATGAQKQEKEVEETLALTAEGRAVLAARRNGK